MGRVLCALSGGVDSSVAAYLLRRQGHDVVGVFMRNGVTEGIGSSKSCCSASDARDAARVADALGIPFYAVDYAQEFGELIDRFVHEYRRGRTPSPCVLCNQNLKFGRLYELARAVGADRIATGHYAILEGGAVYRSADRAKDQTYFLFGVGRENLDRLCFPVGQLTKDEVRALAEQAALATAKKPESMEICFVPTGDYRDLLLERGAVTPGRFVDRNGRDLGPHAGLEFFTVGQRRGLPAMGSPHYVLEIRPDTKEIVLGARNELVTQRCRVSGLRWLIDEPALGSTLPARVQIRARHRATPSTVHVRAAEQAEVVFDSAQEAVTPGQAAVFYQGNRLVGGGWIDE